MNFDAEIRKIKDKLGKKLLILAHHYQRDEIVQLSDFRGDSYQLAREAANSEAELIVFCGVRFMVETAAALAKPYQKVYHPNDDAGCPLAEKAEEDDVIYAWEHLKKILDTNKVTPITYVNSDLELKAFCGKNNGLTCSSSNAEKAFDWAFKRGEKIFFFPDEFLGRNTSYSKGIKSEDMVVWDPKLENGGLTDDEILKAKVILWKGYCHVHTWFKVKHIVDFREKYPGGKVVVHPECIPEVVQSADATGSTSFIVNYVKDASEDTFIGIGTELNLVERLGKENPNKRVVPISEVLCGNMFKITIELLYNTLIDLDTFPVVTVDEKHKENAIIALNRMLEL